MSPAELLFGRKLRCPLDLLKPDLYHRAEKQQQKQKAAHDAHSLNRCFTMGEPVFAHNFLQGPPWLPATVMERLGPLSFKVKSNGGRHDMEKTSRSFETMFSNRLRS